MIDILAFKPKSLEVLKHKGFLLVLEGSVRSSKTLTLNWHFLNYVVESPDNLFIMIGVTVGSLKRNVIDGDYGLIQLSANNLIEKKDSKGYDYLHLKGTDKKIYMFGGQNVSSYKIFRGITAGGVLIDEANQCHPNSIAESFNRTAVSKDRRHMWSLNPDVPAHWIYADYLDKYDKEQPAGYKWFHFDLDDNPAMTEERKKELELQYSGLFYKKFILGLRVSPDGACYPSFDESLIIDELPKDIKPLFIQVGVDIGGNGSATTFNATLFYMQEFLKDNRAIKRLSAIALGEVYDTENTDVETIKGKYKNFIVKLKNDYVVTDVFVDSAEQLILKSIRNMGLVNVRNSLKKPIVDRIRLLDLLMSQKRFLFMRKCKHTIRAVQSAVWDKKSDKLERLDNGTSNIDSLDSLEYSLESKMKEFIS